MSEQMQLERERVAHALRRLKHQPVALLYADNGQDMTWDLPDICGLPVFHIRDLIAPDDRDCAWHAIYKDDSENDGWRFRKLYEDAP